MDPPSADGLDLLVDVRFPNVRSLHTALLSIKSATKQVCLVTFEPSAMMVKWEHESKTMQSGIHLGEGLFSSYTLAQRTSLGVPFHTLLDTLAVFTSSTLAEELSIRYPGASAELLLEAKEEEDAPSGIHLTPGSAPPKACTYARLDTLEVPPFADLLDYWEDPASQFIVPGALLKEAVDDLEWTKGDVELCLERDPPRLSLTSAKDALALDVDIPASQLSGFSCSSPVVRHTYLYKLLRTAFANIPQRDPSGVSTKVAIDASGLMKVTHMLHVAAAGLDGAAGMASHPLASMGTQQTAATVQRVGVAQFVLLPVEQRGESEGQEGGPEDIEGWGV